MTKNLSLKTRTPATAPNMSTGRIAFVEACWHKDIVDQAREFFVATLVNQGVAADRVDIFEVPGSLEIPLQAKLIAETGRYAVIVGAGFVVNGGIYRHDFVAASVIDGIMRVQLETNVPFLSIVLTPLHFHEHGTHHDFFFEHFKVKGREAAEACIKTLENLDRVSALMTA